VLFSCRNRSFHAKVRFSAQSHRWRGFKNDPLTDYARRGGLLVCQAELVNQMYSSGDQMWLVPARRP